MATWSGMARPDSWAFVSGFDNDSRCKGRRCSIAALLTECALWSLDQEERILETCRSLGISFVADSPWAVASSRDASRDRKIPPLIAGALRRPELEIKTELELHSPVIAEGHVGWA